MSAKSRLFKHIPHNLFSVLSGPLKEIHADLLFFVFEQYQKTIYMLPRETIIDMFTDYLEDVDDEVWAAADEETFKETVRDARERAFQLLRKFVDSGWLIQEQGLDYTYKISIPDYALALLQTLDRIRTGYRMEFKGKIVSVYHNLTGSEDLNSSALRQAHEDTMELVDGLKRLNHSIKLYTEKLFEAENIRDILAQIFDEYQADVLGEQYYRLKTSEHVSRYRADILGCVRRFRLNRHQICYQAEKMVDDRDAADRVAAENMLYRWLEYVEDSFENMDDLLEEIDRRNAQYARAAAEQLRFRLHQGRGIEQQVALVLSHLARLARDTGEKVLIPEKISKCIKAFPQAVVDESSWKQPPSARQQHNPQPLASDHVPVEVRKAKLFRFGARVAEEVTVEQINNYVEGILGGASSCPLTGIPMETRDEWVKFIYIILYSRSQRADYSLEGEHGRMAVVKSGRVEIPDLALKKKERSS